MEVPFLVHNRGPSRWHSELRSEHLRKYTISSQQHKTWIVSQTPRKKIYYLILAVRVVLVCFL